MKGTLKAARTNHGFTLIELMITVAIAAILMVVAAPSLITFKRNAELTSATNTLLAAINAARGEAMKRGMNAMVVPANNGTDWNAGWVVFVDKNRLQSYDEATSITVLTQGAIPNYINVEGTGTAVENPAYIMFDASGYSKTKSAGFGALTLSLTRTDTSGNDVYTQTRHIKIASTGRARTCTPSGAADNMCKTTSSE